MSRVQQFIRVLDDPTAPALEGSDPVDPLLLTVIAYVFYADDELADSEIDLFSRLVPDITDVAGHVHELRERPLDIDGLKAAFPTVEARAELFDLCERAVLGDNKVDSGEMDLVEALMRQLGFDA